ncbi:iron ABC transporter permease [Rhizobium sp. TH2]|uniref:lipocalin-like domain-containing protein n=1 Tax=Rhizobium sp. TH2 TaxID=2775403 RepID=UPI00215814ED|nr:lipocalin-like domain-containing protein [Rhizobium sp. TH2]UVC06805.1 iron ABC transporter permease [Rhizobium sp. TH2]
MNAKTVLVVCAAIVTMVFGSSALGQGFAGLGTDTKGFKSPTIGTPLQFPRDFGAHPDFRIEWWYLTANLKGDDGKDYGVQWTLFRSALAPTDKADWSSPQVWLGNAAITTPDHHYVSERLARGGILQAGVTASPFSAWIDDWNMTARAISGELLPDVSLSHLDLAASGADFTYKLELDASEPLVLHGDRGFSVKSETGQASYYYSQPSYAVKGTLKLPGGDVAVTGQAWLDREWSSQPLSPDQSGWDWFSLHLDGGEKLMCFRLRDSRGGYTSGTWIAADGTSTPLKQGEIKLTPLGTTTVAGHTVPIEWKIDLPSKSLSITATALNRKAWMATRFPYWEGPISFKGSHHGWGYLEMTGYD